MKKLLCVAVLVAVIGAGTAFAQFGIGVHGGGGTLGGGGGINLAFSDIYIYVDALGAWDGGMHVSGAVDFLSLYKTNLASNFDFYVRVGVGAGLWGFNDTFGLAAAARVPVGVSWKPIPLIELFLQAVPQIGLKILPSIDLFWGVGGNLGVRFWF